jgi:hypothetical protein
LEINPIFRFGESVITKVHIEDTCCNALENQDDQIEKNKVEKQVENKSEFEPDDKEEEKSNRL